MKRWPVIALAIALLIGLASVSSQRPDAVQRILRLSPEKEALWKMVAGTIIAAVAATVVLWALKKGKRDS